MASDSDEARRDNATIRLPRFAMLAASKFPRLEDSARGYNAPSHLIDTNNPNYVSPLSVMR
jgi:hypothetical protein